ncbi:MAG: LytR/AlgR family response regulator transcription factor, partial [Vicinamibacteria bacterium]
MSVRTLVADDEQLARDELCFLLASLPEIEIVGQASNGLQAVALARELSPDLVLLDIPMPGLDGFQVVRQLMDDDDLPEIVFVTAYDQYAIKAFEVNAIDYLLKPVEKTRLRQAVARALKRKREGEPIETQLERLLGALDRGPRPKRIVVKVSERFMLVDTADVIYASVEDGVVTIVTDRVSGTSNVRTLDELSAVLDPAIFWRVHRGYIVNLERIQEVIPWFNRTIQLKMADRAGTE